MLKNLVKKLVHNIGLKLLALMFAVAMWMAVVNLDDPTINKSFTVAVSIENENAVTSMGKYYEIINDSGNVTFNVSGKRSILDKLSTSDFKATADMTQLIQQEDENIVPVEITAMRYVNQLTISRRSQQLEVSLEDLMRAQFVIQASAQGEPADGYTLGTMEVTPNLLKVSGPKAVVSKIKQVRAAIDVTGMNSKITDSVVPALLDKDGEAIDTTRLTLNLNTVSVRAEILLEKTVSIRAGFSGEPADGYEVISVAPQPETVTIKGKSEVLNAINAIVIPEAVINVDGANEIFEQQVDITKYLPDGVKLSDSSRANVTVKVDVEKLSSRTMTISTENIDIDNLPEGYRIAFTMPTVDIEVFGLKKDLDELVAGSLRPVLDVQGMSAGTHVGQLTLMLNSKYIVAETTVSYTIITDSTDNNTMAGGDDTTAADDTGDTDMQDNENNQGVTDTAVNDTTNMEE